MVVPEFVHIFYKAKWNYRYIFKPNSLGFEPATFYSYNADGMWKIGEDEFLVQGGKRGPSSPLSPPVCF